MNRVPVETAVREQAVPGEGPARDTATGRTVRAAPGQAPRPVPSYKGPEG
ncbi:hypothetical protein OG242_28245 [Streptomyces sp. NBC_00727]